MRQIEKFKKSVQTEIRIYAQKSLEKRLAKQGLTVDDLSADEYEQLLMKEMALLEEDAKKVGSGIVIGSLLTMLFGF